MLPHAVDRLVDHAHAQNTTGCELNHIRYPYPVRYDLHQTGTTCTLQLHAQGDDLGMPAIDRSLVHVPITTKSSKQFGPP